MIVNNAKFEMTAVRPEQYVKHELPEVSFVGRSNVGKSSIINTLINRKALARVGATPGKTREINFYNLDDKLYFVDLPGYGYAGVSKEKKSSWGNIVETYLNTRQQLKLVLMLVDIRHKPTADDQMMYQWILDRNLPHIVVAAKADKISRNAIRGRLKEIAEVLGVASGQLLIPFSSESKFGKEELWEAIDRQVFE